MTRSLAAGVLLVVLALLGLWAAWAVYDLAAIYGDPAGPEWRLVDGLGSLVGIAVGVLGAVAALAVVVARGRARRVVLVTAVVLVGAAVGGIFLGNHYGLLAKQEASAESASAPDHSLGVRPGQM